VNNRARERRSRLRKVDAALDHLTWEALSAVICPSQSTATRLREVRDAPPEMVHVIPYGIDPPRLEPTEVQRLRRLHAPHDELLVGMVVAPDPSGEHARHKGHSVLLEALAQAARRDLRVVILGHDPGPDFAARAEQLGLSGRVDILPGFRDAQPYMAAFDVLAVPSTRDEALPLVIIEAMASATPVVGSRLSGIPEAIVDGETGHILPPGDPGALATKLCGYAEDRASVSAMGERARARYEREFSLERMTARTLAVYEQALSRSVVGFANATSR
jgi:glycosyltransferase involved in cell wall biosynthesis